MTLNYCGLELRKIYDELEDMERQTKEGEFISVLDEKLLRIYQIKVEILKTEIMGHIMLSRE